LELEEIVFPIGHYPLKYMPLFYNQAKALLLTLSGQYDNLSLYVPAKLQSYMSASKPIIAMINGTSRKIIEEANCGYAVEAGDYKKLADIINSVILPDVQAFESLGHNGRNYFTHNYKMEVCINNLCNIIEN
jgi:glycosyltransferase involved in cell wall biosynthesis